MSNNVSYGDVARKLATYNGDPVGFVTEFLGEQLHDGQIRYLLKAQAPTNVLTPCNRWGKTRMLAYRHLYANVFKDGQEFDTYEEFLEYPYQTLNTALSHPIAELVFKEILSIRKRRPQMKYLIETVKMQPFPKIEFRFGSTFHSRSASDGGMYVEGEGYNLISFDEAGYEPDLEETLNGVLAPRTTGRNAKIDIVGTPKGKTYLYKLFIKGLPEGEVRNGYYCQTGKLDDNTFISKEEIQAAKNRLMNDPQRYAQVIEGAFVDYSGTVFNIDHIDKAVDENMEYPADYQHGHRYVSFWDLARKQDYTVGITIDTTTSPWRLVNFTRVGRKETNWEGIYNLMSDEVKRYHLPSIIFDVTGMGGDVIDEELEKRGIPGEGFLFSSKSKEQILTALNQTFGEGNITFPLIAPLIEELSFYVYDDKKIMTDCVMALAGAVYHAREDEGFEIRKGADMLYG